MRAARVWERAVALGNRGSQPRHPVMRAYGRYSDNSHVPAVRLSEMHRKHANLSKN